MGMHSNVKINGKNKHRVDGPLTFSVGENCSEIKFRPMQRNTWGHFGPVSTAPWLKSGTRTFLVKVQRSRPKLDASDDDKMFDEIMASVHRCHQGVDKMNARLNRQAAVPSKSRDKRSRAKLDASDDDIDKMFDEIMAGVSRCHQGVDRIASRRKARDNSQAAVPPKRSRAKRARQNRSKSDF